MNHEILILRPPIPQSDYREVESLVRKADVLTCFDATVDASLALRFIYEKAKFGTETCALIDLNIFRDMLSLCRNDASRKPEHRKLAAALLIFFQTAEILVEPCMALYEGSKVTVDELGLFRRVDNAEPADLLEVFLGKQTMVKLPDYPHADSITPEELKRPLTNSSKIEIALLKLATLLREKMSNLERLVNFLTWSYKEFIFIQEPTILAIHQLAGNGSKPLLRGYNKTRPEERIEGVRNALWDCLLIREWCKRVEQQSSDSRVWLLATRDQTLRDYARQMIVTGEAMEKVDHVIESIVARSWNEPQAKKIARLYRELQSTLEDETRAANIHKKGFDLPGLKSELQSKLMA